MALLVQGMSMKRLAVAMMAVLGFKGRAALETSPTPQVQAVTDGTGLHPYVPRSGRRPSHAPKDWGQSQACARMVRKNRLHAQGLSHARI